MCRLPRQSAGRREDRPRTIATRRRLPSDALEVDAQRSRRAADARKREARGKTYTHTQLLRETANRSLPLEHPGR